MNFCNSMFVRQICRNRLLRSMWLMLPLSRKMRLRIFRRFHQRFSLIPIENLNKKLIAILEKEPHLIAGLEKNEEVLKLLKKNKLAAVSPEFPEIWLQKSAGGETVFNFNGAVLPRLSNEHIDSFQWVFADTFLFSVLFNDNYSAELVERLEGLMPEGPYGYTAENFDVTVKTGDVVIDAGAWIGDFSAYAAARGAKAYAFEPALTTFNGLQKTADLNNNFGGGGGFSR